MTTSNNTQSMKDFINNNLAKAIRQIITSEQLDADFSDKTNELLNAYHTAPFTTVETQAAQKSALWLVYLSNNQK